LGVDVSIIVLTKNGCLYLREVLDEVLNHSSRYPCEVVLIDSGSSDGSWEIAQSFPIQVHQIAPEEFNHGETRNLGARLADPSARYLVYLTQDATPLEGWLDNLLQPLEEDDQVAGAFSRHVPRPDCAPSMRRLMCNEWAQTGTAERVVKRMISLTEYEQNQAYYAYFSNTSSAIRRSVWQQFPFARVDFAEDSQWADKVLRAGYSLVYEPASQVWHSHNYSLRQQFAQNVDHARAMKALHDPPAYRKVHPIRAGGQVARRTAEDWAYIRTLKASPFRKIYWTLHAPLWQLATELGSHIGAHSDALPRWFVQRVSRQTQVRGD
jgi:rhamnosyltransferase